MRTLIFLALTVQLVSAAGHSLQYLYTAVTPGINFPEFTLIGLVDGEQIVYYDSNIRRMIPKTEWMKKAMDGDPYYWSRNIQWAQASQEDFRISLDIAMQRYNHTEGVHTVQWMYGCEEYGDGTRRGYDRYGYDGEDFLSLDLNTGTWTAANANAVITKQKLETTRTANYVKAYLLNECPDWLETYVGYGRSTLERKVPPEVDLFQQDSSSPVVCHATGFFPKAVMISWQKNGEDLDEDVHLRETLPNQDGTFQRRSILIVSPEELDKHNYTCIIQHSSLEEKVLQVADRRVLSGGGPVGAIIGAVVAVLLLLIIGCVGVLIWIKEQSGFKLVSGKIIVPSEGDPASTSSNSGPSGGSLGIRIGAVVAVLLLLTIGCVGVLIWMMNQSDGVSVGIIICVVVAGLLLLTMVCVGLLIWIKEQSGFKRESGNLIVSSEGDPAPTSSNLTQVLLENSGPRTA